MKLMRLDLRAGRKTLRVFDEGGDVTVCDPGVDGFKAGLTALPNDNFGVLT